MLKWISFCIAVGLALAIRPAAAAGVDILTLDSNPTTLNLARAAEHALQQLQPAIDTSVIPIAAAERTPARNRLAIAIGDDTLDWAASVANGYAATLCFYVSSGNYAGLGNRPQASALFRDQPLTRQLLLARALLPGARSALVIHSQPLRTAGAVDRARYADFTLRVFQVDSNQDWAKSLSRWVSENDVLIGIEDRALYNRETIRSVLLTTYRHGKVLIGPNRGFVGAGSLASAYTSPEQYLQQLQTMVQHWQLSGALPPAQFPSHYQVTVNRQVANSLGLNVPDDLTLEKVLQEKTRQAGESLR